MKYTKLLSIIAGFAVAGISATQAADSQLLDTLVKKGYLSSAEAKEIGTGSDFAVTNKRSTTKKIRFFGRVHAQYDVVSTDDGASFDPASENNFLLRRTRLGAEADLGNGWSGTIVADYASGNGANGTSQVLDKAYISWNAHENAKLQFGYKKVPFGKEDNTSSTKIKSVERSLSNRFFVEQWDMGGRHTGIFVSGDFDNTLESEFGSIYYKAAVTNSGQGRINAASGTTSNSPSYWGTIGIEGKRDQVGYDFGFNLGVRSDETLNGNGLTGAAARPGASDTIYGAYGVLDWNNFRLFGEFMWASFENARVFNAQDSDAFGFTVQPSYRFDDFELVYHFSTVSADGSNVDISTTSRRAGENTNNYKEATQHYIGANWYIVGNTVKLSGGYEFTEYEQSNVVGTADTDVDGIRLRMQLLF